MGWFGRSPRLVFSAFRRYSSKTNDVIRTPISTTRRISQFSQPIFVQNGFKSVQFCNNGGAKRFYSVGRNQLGSFVRLISNDEFQLGMLLFLPWALIFISCFGIVPYTNRIQFVHIPIKSEKALGKTELRARKSKLQWKLLPYNHPETRRVLVIADNLIEALNRDLNIEMPGEGVIKSIMYKRHLKGFYWKVIVVDDPAVNVYCLPGGKLIVYSGLLKYLSSDAEIASIIAHEVAHVVARHWVEKITKLCLRSLVGLSFGLSHLVTPTCVLDEIRNTVDLPLSMRMEIEADYIGLMLMASAGYDPRVAPGVINKLARKTHQCVWRFATHRVEAVSQASVMQKAMILYRYSLHARNNLYKSQLTNVKLMQ